MLLTSPSFTAKRDIAQDHKRLEEHAERELVSHNVGLDVMVTKQVSHTSQTELHLSVKLYARQSTLSAFGCTAFMSYFRKFLAQVWQERPQLHSKEPCERLSLH
jgi:hypothetical protein